MFLAVPVSPRLWSNISATIGWTTIAFGTCPHSSLRMDPNDLGDPLTFSCLDFSLCLVYVVKSIGWTGRRFWHSWVLEETSVMSSLAPPRGWYFWNAERLTAIRLTGIIPREWSLMTLATPWFFFLRHHQVRFLYLFNTLCLGPNTCKTNLLCSELIRMLISMFNTLNSDCEHGRHYTFLACFQRMFCEGRQGGWAVTVNSVLKWTSDETYWC